MEKEGGGEKCKKCFSDVRDEVVDFFFLSFGCLLKAINNFATGCRPCECTFTLYVAKVKRLKSNIGRVLGGRSVSHATSCSKSRNIIFNIDRHTLSCLSYKFLFLLIKCFDLTDIDTTRRL